MSHDLLRAHGVLLLLIDGPEDVVAARRAAAHAKQTGTRVLAVVLLPASVGPPAAGTTTGSTARVRQDAAAVSARVQPVVSSYDVPLTAVPLLLPRGRARWTRWRLRRTLRLLAGRSGAELVVVPARHIFGFAPEAVAALVPGGVVAHATGATRASPL